MMVVPLSARLVSQHLAPRRGRKDAAKGRKLIPKSSFADHDACPPISGLVRNKSVLADVRRLFIPVASLTSHLRTCASITAGAAPQRPS
jgi:hypothetical protein